MFPEHNKRAFILFFYTLSTSPFDVSLHWNPDFVLSALTFPAVHTSPCLLGTPECFVSVVISFRCRAFSFVCVLKTEVDRSRSLSDSCEEEDQWLSFISLSLYAPSPQNIVIRIIVLSYKTPFTVPLALLPPPSGSINGF